MQGTDFKFPENALVRLKDGDFSDFYGGQATFGSEAKLTKRKKDKFGLPLVWVEWDKTHWRYNGAMDGWSFEDHFELVKEPKVAEEKSKSELKLEIENLLQRLEAVANDPDTDTEMESVHPELVQQATAAIEAAEAFVLITVTREPDERAPQGLLRPDTLAFSKSQEGAMVASAHMATLAAKAHQALALKAIAAENA